MLNIFGLILFCFCTISYAQDLDNQDRIIGGNFSDIKQFRSHVAVLYYGGMYCGGSLVKWNGVLTAGHCTYQVTAADLSVRAGSTNYGSGGVLVPVLEIVRQPYFDYNSITHDISLLKLDFSLQSYAYNYPIAVIPIADTMAPVDSTVVLPGWGDTGVNNSTSPTQLRSAYMQVILKSRCEANYGTLDASKICAGIWNGGIGACHGDSGGGLRYNGYIIGTVSYGHICAEAYFPTIFANAVYMRNWIINMLATF